MTGAVQTLTVFRTSDGLTHENLQEAEAHQTTVNLREAFKSAQAGRPGGMGWVAFLDFLVRNAPLLREYLSTLEDGG